jgi:hypothetical protein
MQIDLEDVGAVVSKGQNGIVIQLLAIVQLQLHEERWLVTTI